MKPSLWTQIQTLNAQLSTWTRGGVQSLVWGKTAVLTYHATGEIIVRDPTKVVVVEEGGTTHYAHGKAIILRIPPSTEWEEGEVEALRAAVEQIGLTWPEGWTPP